MIEIIIEKLTRWILIPKVRRAEERIGYKLAFRHIPDRYIQGSVSWDMTDTFKKFGLNVETGVNYWTMGKIVNGTSARYDRTALEYQSWLGGYLVKFPSKQSWTVEDHFKLAIADQNSWLKTYGDPHPLTDIAGWKFASAGAIRIGDYSGTLYEGGCTTHSDVGGNYKNFHRLEANVMAALLNSSNSNLRIKSSMLLPRDSSYPYETMKMPGYIAIFEIEENIKAVLYGNSTAGAFEILKNDLVNGMKSMEIKKI